MDSIIFIIILFIILVIASVFLDIFIEKHSFNKCTCRKCGEKLRMYDTDSQGGRGYCCDKCGHHIWVRWRLIDKKYMTKNNDIVEPVKEQTEEPIEEPVEEPETATSGIDVEKDIFEDDDLEDIN